MTTQRDRARALLDEHGRTFADECGIGVAKGTPSVLWQLLLASHLLSSRISAELAVRATKVVGRAFPTAQKMHDATEHAVWEALDEGDYLRKQRTATMLHETAAHCVERWGGDLRRLREQARDARAAADLLQEFKGMGPVGAEVFLREVQVAWPELAPFAGSRALEQAGPQGLPADTGRLAGLVEPDEVPRLMAALVRSGLAKPDG